MHAAALSSSVRLIVLKPKMDNKITLTVLAQMLSDRTGNSRKECEELLRSFFRTISASLSAGEPVKIRGFGTFKITTVDARMSVDVSSGEDYEIPAHNRIVFIPAKELAGMVNAPFSMFETIELSDEVADDELMSVGADEVPAERDESDARRQCHAATDADDSCVRPGEGHPIQSEAEEHEKVADSRESEELAEIEADTEVEAAAAEYVKHTAPSDPEASEPSEEIGVSAALSAFVADSAAESQSHVAEQRRKFHYGFIWGMAVAVAVVVAGCVVLYFLNDDFGAMMGRNIATESAPRASQQAEVPGTVSSGAEAGIVAAADMAVAESDADGIMEDEVSEKDEASMGNAVPTHPSDQLVYDTVTPTSGLGYMARKHYANYHFWSYIYKENENILGHPDHIRTGTRVVIPPLSKYGVNPKDASDEAKARRLGAEIYARYKGKE